MNPVGQPVGAGWGARKLPLDGDESIHDPRRSVVNAPVRSAEAPPLAPRGRRRRALRRRYHRRRARAPPEGLMAKARVPSFIVDAQGEHAEVDRDLSSSTSRRQFFWLDLHGPRPPTSRCSPTCSSSIPSPWKTRTHFGQRPKWRSSTTSPIWSRSAPTVTRTASWRSTASSAALSRHRASRQLPALRGLARSGRPPNGRAAQGVMILYIVVDVLATASSPSLPSSTSASTTSRTVSPAARRRQLQEIFSLKRRLVTWRKVSPPSATRSRGWSPEWSRYPA